MRRPTPLPPTAVAAPRASEPEAEVEAPGFADEAETSLAPVAVLTPPDAERAEAVPDDPSDAASDAASQIGVRELWRAARARRRALRAEVRRFTGRQRRRRLAWALSLGGLAVLVVGTVAAAYSPLFAVERIHVVGAQRLDPTAVESALAGQLGTPLPLVDDSAVKAALVAFPLVETYTLEARPPHEIVVRLVERTPVGVVSTPAGFTLVDAAGVALSTTPGPVDGQPVIDAQGGTKSKAFAAAGQVVRTLPDDIRAQVTAVAATTPDDVTLTLGGTGTTVVWGSADDSAMKAIALQKMMIQRPPGSVNVYDVSSPTAIVVR